MCRPSVDAGGCVGRYWVAPGIHTTIVTVSRRLAGKERIKMVQKVAPLVNPGAKFWGISECGRGGSRGSYCCLEKVDSSSCAIDRCAAVMGRFEYPYRPLSR